MTRDNLYWLSHDQVALFKTFRGTALRCKQTINHAVPRIKQSSSLLYDFLLHLLRKERERKEVGIASAENMEGERKKLPGGSHARLEASRSFLQGLGQVTWSHGHEPSRTEPSRSGRPAGGGGGGGGARGGVLFV
ncbi:hypothetical protein Lal_00032974 [Lupinus albus]|nr:hypothetical protein Lal_00032974 [Lupinus albus]